MDWQTMKAAGQAVSAWAPTMLVIGGIVGFFVLRKYQKERIALESELHHTQMALNVEIVPRLFDDGRGGRILEIGVEVKNASRRMWCVPAVYVSARALADLDARPTGSDRINVTELPACPPLTHPVNAAYLPQSVIQIGPGETEYFVRWDRVDATFVERFPIVVLIVEVFGAGQDLLGETRYPTLKRGSQRADWLRFLPEHAARNGGCMVMGRWTSEQDAQAADFSPGDRCILRLRDGVEEPDAAASQRFRPVLESVSQWSRQKTLDLVSEPRERSRQG